MDYEIKKLPGLNQPPKVTSSNILKTNPELESKLPDDEEEVQVIEMNFGNQSKRTALPNEKKKSKKKANKDESKDEPKVFNYVYGLLMERNLTKKKADKFVKEHLQKIAPSAHLTHVAKENQFLLWVQDKDSKYIKDLIQKCVDEDKFVYVNDGSDVIVRPGMTYNQLTHQRIQLMNYRCYLDRNDPKTFKMRVRPIFLNKQYWIIEDGKDFAQVMKDAFTRLENKDGNQKSMAEKKVEYQIDHMMIRKWVDRGLVYAQYQSLKYKKQDLEKMDKTKPTLEAISNLNRDMKEMRKIYKYRLKEWKALLENEDEKYENNTQN